MVPFGYDGCSCIGVRNSFKLIISTTSGDAECNVLLSSGEDCFNVKSRCSDLNNIFNSTFFSVCNNLNSNENLPLLMCFGNITEELIVKDIKLYLTTSTSKCGQFLRRYDRGFDIQLQGKFDNIFSFVTPLQNLYFSANIALNHETNEVCIYHPGSTCAISPEDNHLHVSVSDISQYLIFNNNITIGTCVYVKSIQFAFCAPFQVILNDMENNLHISQGLYTHTLKIIITANTVATKDIHTKRTLCHKLYILIPLYYIIVIDVHVQIFTLQKG